MIIYTDSTVFNTPVQTIVNTVNCVGVMGAGLALECQLRFPEMYLDYVELCKQKKVQLGKPYVYREYEHTWIMNFPTKNHWKYPSKLEWIENGLQYFVDKYEKGGITSIAFPKLGCDKGGLEWSMVKTLMEKYLGSINIDIYICLDQTQQASGIEKVMIDLLESRQDTFESLGFILREDIINKIKYSLPITRFRDLLKIDGIGKQTYFDLFRVLYSEAIKYKNANYMIRDEIEVSQKSDNLHHEKIVKNTISFDEEEDVNLATEDSSDVFNYILPRLEKQLSSEYKSQDLARLFNVRQVQMRDWLERGVELGKFKKLHNPVRYISKNRDNQLELPLQLSQNN